ncbi:MAG: aspartate carbamoyltransferase catalytic subunit [Cyanobacteria bacterium HKST-UBA04]|nr:aspartate carbamoyltransferase catalytic subunit [Cyanobacteria bacterium HKST-UBA04]MCA9842770.1 aspartate carbamoyltransferase catalytic subunit [Cyanobacteria bacterium HKST-UBA03]
MAQSKAKNTPGAKTPPEPSGSEPPPLSWAQTHLLDAHTLTADEVETVLAEARTFAEILNRPVKKVPLLRGKVIVNLFYENSTRTRTSFELAGKYLSADTINFSVDTSSVKKGETLIDTAQTLMAMGIDAVVIRHASPGVPYQLAQFFGHRVSVLNAGDGMHEHPTQSLLDLYSMRQRLESVEGRKVVIVGDILHSRVARSNIHLLNKLGADVHAVGPTTLLPADLDKLGCTVHHQIEPALQQADVVMCLRLQLERQQSGLIPSLGEYARLFGINRHRLMTYPKPNVLLMHPGPMNRGVEITSDVADDPAVSLILNQVTSGVAIRMALLHLLIGHRDMVKQPGLDVLGASGSPNDVLALAEAELQAGGAL